MNDGDSCLSDPVFEVTLGRVNAFVSDSHFVVNPASSPRRPALHRRSSRFIAAAHRPLVTLHHRPVKTIARQTTHFFPHGLDPLTPRNDITLHRA